MWLFKLLYLILCLMILILIFDYVINGIVGVVDIDVILCCIL